MVSFLRTNRRFVTAWWIIGLVLFPWIMLRAAEVNAELDQDSVPAGQGATLSLTITGGQAEEPEMPTVENLIIQSRGRSQQMRIINGITSVSMSYNFTVGSHTPGDYQIPPIHVMVDGQKLSTRALKLKVLDSGAARPPAGMPNNPAGAQPSAGEQTEVDTNKFGFLTVEMADSSRKYVYVGEIAPVRIRAWIPQDSRANLRSGIKPEGKAFTLHHVSERPEQSYETRNGKTYLVVTWFGGISATKDGKYPISLSVDATVAVRDHNALKPRRRTGGPFDDPFFNNIFEDMNVPMIQKDVSLKSDDQEIEVRPLPAEGRPDGFTGAVGDFKFDDLRMPNTWKTGEPQQIGVGLSGTGNFALMKAPGIVPSENWKVYPGKEEFAAGDEASFSGNKKFQFSAVPRKGGAQNVALNFSFFDPSTGAYKTITSTEHHIQVEGKDIVEQKTETMEKPIEPPVKKDQTELVGIHAARSTVRTLVPLVSRPLFGWLLGGSAGLCVLGGILRWIRRHRENPIRIARAAMEKSANAATQAARERAAVGDAAGFFAAGRQALQYRAGFLWNQAAQAITTVEVHSHVAADSPVLAFFREADRHEYSPPASGNMDPQWPSMLDKALATLTQQNA